MIFHIFALLIIGGAGLLSAGLVELVGAP